MKENVREFGKCILNCVVAAGNILVITIDRISENPVNVFLT